MADHKHLIWYRTEDGRFACGVTDCPVVVDKLVGPVWVA